jgi:hypothetical protein
MNLIQGMFELSKEIPHRTPIFGSDLCGLFLHGVSTNSHSSASITSVLLKMYYVIAEYEQRLIIDQLFEVMCRHSFKLLVAMNESGYLFNEFLLKLVIGLDLGDENARPDGVFWDTEAISAQIVGIYQKADENGKEVIDILFSVMCCINIETLLFGAASGERA